MRGTVYLIHFERPYHHAAHYLGWTRDLTSRIAEHRAGRGARLIEVINEAGIEWSVVQTWPGDRRLERKLKNRKKSRCLCPVCLKERRQVAERAACESSSHLSLL